LREYVPGNLVYANGNKFVPRRFHLEAEEPLAFAVDVAAESVQELGAGDVAEGSGSLAATHVRSIPMCDVDAPHQSFISDDEDYRFQMAVAVFGHEQGRHSGGEAWEWGAQSVQLFRGISNPTSACSVAQMPFKTSLVTTTMRPFSGPWRSVR